MATRGWQDVTAKQVAGMGRRIATVSKYHAVKTRVDGITFDSKREAQRYCELRLLEKAGQIRGLETHPPFDLHVEGERIGRYIPDFTYRTGIHEELIVEDVKGVKTALYRWKKKHFEIEYGIVIQEIR